MRKTAAAAAMAASLTIGGGAGAVLFAPNLVGAQTDDTGSEESQRPEGGAFLSEALAPLVDSGTIDQGQADAVITAIEEAKPEGLDQGRRGRHHAAHVAGEAVTDLLGVDAAELRELLADGQTLAEIGAANGVSVDQLVDALVSEATERLDAAVEDDHLSEDEAADKLAEATERAEARVNGEGDLDGRRGPGPRGHADDGAPAGS